MRPSMVTVDDFLLDFSPYGAIPRGLPMDRGAVDKEGGVRFVHADSKRGEVPFRDSPSWPDYVAILGAEDVPDRGAKLAACVVPLVAAFAVGYMLFRR